LTITEQNSTYSRELRDMLLLRHEPIAIKMIENEADVPSDAIRPQKDMGTHMALCQAFSLSRREYKTIYMVKEEHWCWNPLIGLGHVDCSEGTDTFNVVTTALGIPDMEKARAFFAEFPRFPLGRYKGIVTAPLKACPFDPDVVLIYSNNAQLRAMLWGIKAMTGQIVNTDMDAIDSCVYAIVVPMQDGEYRVTLPDIGEFERAAPGEDEIILSVPKGRMEELIRGMRFFEDRKMGYTGLKRELDYDFSRPPFYNTLFEMWGLEKGRDRV
jgi:uncharacterized protein (DUF169 family)